MNIPQQHLDDYERAVQQQRRIAAMATPTWFTAQYGTPGLTDAQVAKLADCWLSDAKVREAMETLGQTREEYIGALRKMYPVPTFTATSMV